MLIAFLPDYLSRSRSRSASHFKPLEPAMRIAMYIFTAAYAYYTFKRARRTGEWSWARFFILLGAIVLFFICFMLPIMSSKLFDTHFNLMFGIMMTGIAAFTGMFVYLYRKPPVREEAAAPASPISTSQGDVPKASVLAFAVFVLCSTAAHAQGLYKDPAGAFTVQLPAGWQSQAQADSPIVSFVNEKFQASLSMGVMHGSETKTPTADKELESIQSQFPQNCPQAKIVKRGPATLGGMSGAFLLVGCTNDKGGSEVMKFAVASKPGLLVVLNSASPGPNYDTVLPALNSIEHSLKLLTVAAPKQTSAPVHSGPKVYRDPQGRYRLAVPDGWAVTPPQDAGSGTVQLSSGLSWAMLMPSSGAQPRDVNHQVTQQIQAQFTDFKLLNEGDLQVNGHSAHGTTATGINPKGARVSILVLSIDAGSGHYLTVISSSPNDQAKNINAAVMQMAQSIRFGGEGE
jgi:hypothetical protein